MCLLEYIVRILCWVQKKTRCVVLNAEIITMFTTTCHFNNCAKFGSPAKFSERVTGKAYKGKDSPLCFCPQHTPFMFDLYAKHKALESKFRGTAIYQDRSWCDYRLTIYEPKALKFLARQLSDMILARVDFQNHLKKHELRSTGHDFFIALLELRLKAVQHQLRFKLYK